MAQSNNDPRLLDITIILNQMGVEPNANILERMRYVAENWERRQRGRMYSMTDENVKLLLDVYDYARVWAAMNIEHERATMLGTVTSTLTQQAVEAGTNLKHALAVCETALGERANDVRTKNAEGQTPDQVG